MNTSPSTGAKTAPAASWRSPLLGDARRQTLPQGVIHYWERGQGPVLLFVHGWLVNANLWRDVIDALATRFHCIALDMPLGSHLHAMDAHAKLDPDGCGRLIADFMTARDLLAVTLVGNDSGGAYAQVAASLGGGRVERIILTNCETPHDPFPPTAFDGLVEAAESPSALRQVLSHLKNPAVRASRAGYGGLCKSSLGVEVADSYVLPIGSDDGVLNDAAKAMRGAHQRYVAAAGKKLQADFTGPVRFIWAPECPFFPLESAIRYAAELHDASVATLEDAYSFIPEDQPRRLAEAIVRAVAA